VPGITLTYSLNSRMHNNRMQLTRSGHSRWRPSQLILVLDVHLHHGRGPKVRRAAAGGFPAVAMHQAGAVVRVRKRTKL
jgi:hypothetical protein